jgi:outer membrane protein X
MKSIFGFPMLLFLLLWLPGKVNAQDTTRVYKRFKVDLSMGLAIPQSYDKLGFEIGVLLAAEPKYAIIDQLSIGIRLEAAYMVQNLEPYKEFFKGNPINIGTELITADYYFSNSKFRPLVGLGIGVSSVNIPDEKNTEYYISESVLGGMIRSGFEFGKFRMGIEYNMNGSVSFSKKNNYWGIKIGFLLGGKKIKL